VGWLSLDKVQPCLKRTTSRPLRPWTPPRAIAISILVLLLYDFSADSGPFVYSILGDIL